MGISELTRLTYQELLTNAADANLRARGFRRRGKTWRWTRKEPDPRLTNVIDVQQRSSFDWQYDQIRFTLNWAIFVRGYSEIAREAHLAEHPDSPVGDRPAPKHTTARTAAAPFSIRIGRLSPTGHDLWWCVSGQQVTYQEAGRPPQPLRSAPDALLRELVANQLPNTADRPWTAPELLSFIEQSDLLLHFVWFDRTRALALLRELLGTPANG